MSSIALTLPTSRRGPVLGSIVVWLVVATLAGLVYWSSVSSIDQVARATGTVIASRRVQVIQSVDGGVLTELAVAEGDRVRAGQVLARFDDVKPKSELVAAESKRAALMATFARLRAELDGKPVAYPPEALKYPEFVRVQNDLLAGRRENLRTDLAGLSGIVAAARGELVITEKLAEGGDSSQLELLRARRQVTEAQTKLDSRRNQYIQDVNTELAKTRDELDQVRQQATQRQRQFENIVVTTPMDGIVKNVRFTTLGAVLKPGDELLTIVPIDDRMIVEAKVAPRDIALVHPGLEAMLKFDAYDYTIYGSVHGQVAYVSADSMRDESQPKDDKTAASTYYRVHVLTSAPALTQTGKTIDVIPGMTASVDIRTGKRSVLEFLMKPVTKTLSEAFGER